MRRGSDAARSPRATAGLVLAVALFFLPGCATGPDGTGRARGPNILFFLVDDQRADQLGCAGHAVLKTPVIDGLVARGVSFRNAFVTTPICAASRASILTGLWEHSHEYTFGRPPISATHVRNSYPFRLKAAGYQTGFIGKFGVRVTGDERAGMFDSFRPIGLPYFKKQKDGSVRHSTELCGDAAIEFLASRQSDRPFCLSVSFNASHAVDGNREPGRGHFPWPRAMDGLYDDVDIAPPPLGENARNALPPFLRDSMNRRRFFWRWDTPEKYATNMRAYYRMISGIDHVIGRVLGELRRLGLAEDTVVVFSSDNGYFMGNRGFAGKWTHHEESLRVPLIIADPRRPVGSPGVARDQLVLNTDLAETFCDIAGLDPVRGSRGRSLLPLMAETPPARWREDFFCEHRLENNLIPKWEGVRTEHLTYARYVEHDHEFLHDRRIDPDQIKNLALDPDHAKTLRRMRLRTDELRRRHQRLQR